MRIENAREINNKREKGERVQLSLLSLCKRAFVCVKTARLCVCMCVYKNARALFFSLFIMWKSLLFVVAAFHFFARAREDVP
jgi:hypothetical protein